MQTSLVGDLIMGIRETATDLPLSLSPPSNVSASISGATGSTTFSCVVTQSTPWGESAPSTEVSVITAAPSSTFSVSGNISYAATSVNIYFTILGAGMEDRYFPVSIPGPAGAFTANFSLSSNGIVVAFPPVRSSAWLPDTDGTALSASSIYRWINEGLDAMVAITEGIRDMTGVPSIGGQAQYQLIGNWKKMTNGFYDGYPFGFGNKFDVFRHSNVTGIVGTMVLDKDADVQVVEIWPQANRTAGVGTLSGSLTVTATTINYTPGASGFVLGFGIALLGPYPADLSQCEIVQYSGTGSGSQLTNLQRGMGGTIAQAWPNGTQVSELNITMFGLRNALHYAKGQAANNLSLPPANIDAMRLYLEARFKKAEQDLDGHDKIMRDFEKKCQAIKSTKIVMGPRQIAIGGTSGVETAVGAGSFFGGVIIP